MEPHDIRMKSHDIRMEPHDIRMEPHDIRMEPLVPFGKWFNTWNLMESYGFIFEVV